MTPRVRRIVIPLIVLGVAIGIGFSVVAARQSQRAAERAATEAQAQTGIESGNESGIGAGPRNGGVGASGANDGAADGSVDGDGRGASDSAAPGATPLAAPPEDLDRWRPAAPSGGLAARGGATPLGSFDPELHRLRIEFADRGAGVERVVFSDYWETARAKRAAEAARRDGTPIPAEFADQRYVLQQAIGLRGFSVPLLAMNFIEVEGRKIGLFGEVWSSDAPGQFVSEIRAADETPVLRVRRHFVVSPGSYDIEVRQSVENLTDAPVRVRLMHYGPPDLRLDRDRYMDIRRHHFGYVLPGSPAGRPATVISDGQMVSRADVLKRLGKGDISLWPNQESTIGRLDLSWHGTTNRYFAMAIHPTADDVAGGMRTFDSVDEILANRGVADGSDEVVLTEVYTPTVTVAPGAVERFDLSVYAGPLDSNILAVVEPYASLGMSGLILYLMSECCTMCTFPWLARLLLVFLSFLHDWVFHDWALSIIGLVLVVRLLLHPLMKRSQIQMQRFGKAMAEMKPEIDRLQQKHKGDPQRIQAEQMRLYREKGVSPVGCLGGIIPTLLQMPIWIALYAMLYFAFELRQQPAFFGIFQLFGGWSFLGDLSASDHFFGEFDQARNFLLWNVTGINLLPLLMGVVFFFQQKYMTPPTTVKLSPEQEQQQKLMKIMMVVMFPLMLYSAPSGLTLYILTSSIIGIFESRHIRRHIAHLDSLPKVEGPKKKKQDMLGRMYEKALDRARERAAQKKRPQKRFKDRDE